MSSEDQALCCCTHCRAELPVGEELCAHGERREEEEHGEAVLLAEQRVADMGEMEADEQEDDDVTLERPAVAGLERSEKGEEGDVRPPVVAVEARAKVTAPLDAYVALPVTPLPSVQEAEVPTTDPITPIPLALDGYGEDKEGEAEAGAGLPEDLKTPAPRTIRPVTLLPLAVEEGVSTVKGATATEPLIDNVPGEHERGVTWAVLMGRARGMSSRVPVWLFMLVAGLLTMLVQGFRLGSAPDIFSDEGVYFLVAANIAQGHGLIVDHTGFFWHPPAYMLIEAIYIKLAGLAYADVLTGVLAARYVNVLLAGCTTVVLILLGRKVHSYKAGFVIALFFLLDPYVQRINRRNMLETLAMLAVLLGLYCFFSLNARVGRWQRSGAGVAFGVALLTKEAMFLEVLALLLYVAWCKRSQVRDLMWVVGIACGVYLLYPLWAFVVGQWNNYLAYKQFGIDRIIVRIQNAQSIPTSSTITLVGSSRGDLVDAIVARLAQYGMSYVLIALAAVLSIVLVLRFRHVEAAQYLAVWNIFSIGFGFVLGGVSDQYFYYLIVSSICVVGFTATLLLEGGSSAYAKAMLADVPGWLQRFSALYLFLFRLLWRPLLVLLALMLLVNGATWTRTYAVGSDDAYMSIVRYVR